MGTRTIRLQATLLAASLAGTASLAPGAEVGGADAASATPCDDPSTPGDTEAAKRAFREGQQAFHQGAYEAAAKHWTEAYSRDCSAHALLLNLAMAWELLGRWEEAIHALRLFNKRSPESPYAEPNERRIERLRQSADRDPPPSPASKPEACSDSRPVPGRASQATPAALPEPDAPWSSVPLAVTGAGALLAVAGGALYAKARSEVAELRSRCGPGGACGDPGLVIEGEKARARAGLSGWALGGGLTLTLGGLAWYLLDRDSLHPRDTAANRIRWTAAVGSDGASLQLVGPL